MVLQGEEEEEEKTSEGKSGTMPRCFLNERVDIVENDLTTILRTVEEKSRSDSASAEHVSS